MGRMEKEEIKLLLDMYYKENAISECYSYIGYSNENKMLFNWGERKNYPLETRKIYSVKNVPAYFKTQIANEETYTIKKHKQVKGYSICLDGHSEVDIYLKQQFKDKGKTIKRYIRRLETCFDIKYKLFYGYIDKEEYDFLLGTLKKMILERFKQRGEESESIAIWEQIFKTAHGLINAKKASLFVIYHGNKPIEIALNYNYDKILFSYISSYDISYSKFGLGHVEIYKQLEWCIANGYRFFEMGWGDLDYKRRWSNAIYNFEHHLIFPKKSILAHFYALIEGGKTELITYLIAKKVNVYYRNAKNFLKRKKNEPVNAIQYSLETVENMQSLQNLVPLDYYDDKNSFLHPIVNDILYTSMEHIRDMKLYELKERETYIVQGKKYCQKIVFTEKK